jgi:hypothetical protein
VFGSAFHEFDGMAAMIASIGPLTNVRVNGEGDAVGSDAGIGWDGAVVEDVEADVVEDAVPGSGVGVVDAALFAVTSPLLTALAPSGRALLNEGVLTLLLVALPEPPPHAASRQPVAVVCKISIARR